MSGYMRILSLNGINEGTLGTKGKSSQIYVTNTEIKRK